MADTPGTVGDVGRGHYPDYVGGGEGSRGGKPLILLLARRRDSNTKTSPHGARDQSPVRSGGEATLARYCGAFDELLVPEGLKGQGHRKF